MHKLFLKANLKRFFFVCVGNTCRSPMAEGFAKSLYGSDVLSRASAGLSPVEKVALLTVATMQEKNIDISAHWDSEAL